MIIIGEKINGAIPSTAKAIAEKDEAYIRDLALRQTEFGAHFLDVCAGTAPEIERETLTWLIDVVQDTVDTPLCIDSADVEVIEEMLPKAKRPGIVNSVSEERGKCDKLFPRIAGSEWKIIALACDDNGISQDAEVKFSIIVKIMEKAKAHGISEERMFLDPLVTTLSTNGDSLLTFIQTLKKVRETYPEAHITSGLSNISFGMPLRKYINRTFLTLATYAGMDSAILDPTSEDMRATLLAAEALLGNDKHCRRYLTAFRKGTIGRKA